MQRPLPASRHPPAAGHPADPAERPPRSLGCRLLLGGIAVLMACGAGIASLGILARPIAKPSPSRAGLVRGEFALRPDLLRQVHWPFGGIGLDRRFDPPPPPEAAQPRERAPTIAEALTSAPHARRELELVRDFCHELGTSPGQAVRFVTRELIGARWHRVVRAWEQVESVLPQHVTILPNDAVVVDVTTAYADGTLLDLRYLFTVEHSATPRINGAELLTATNHPAP